jgi:hypothetical protein
MLWAAAGLVPVGPRLLHYGDPSLLFAATRLARVGRRFEVAKPAPHRGKPGGGGAEEAMG